MALILECLANAVLLFEGFITSVATVSYILLTSYIYIPVYLAYCLVLSNGLLYVGGFMCSTYDRRMMRYLAGVRWQNRVTSEEVARRCGIREMEVILWQRRLQWFGHVRRLGQDSVVKMVVEVEGRRPVGRPRKVWRKCIEQDLNQLGLREEMAQDSRGWRRVINCPTP